VFTFCEGSHGDNKIIQAMATEANIKPSEKSYLLERLHRSVNIMSLLALLSRKLVLHLPCPLLLLPFNGHASPIMAAKLVHGFSDTHTHTHCTPLPARMRRDRQSEVLIALNSFYITNSVHRHVPQLGFYRKN
jgi:hypothetical protein